MNSHNNIEKKHTFNGLDKKKCNISLISYTLQK